MISTGSSEVAFEESSSPNANYTIPPAITSSSTEELLLNKFASRQLKVNSVEEGKFVKGLSRANNFIRNYPFPFDGKRSLDDSRYNGELDIITVERIMESTLYITWSTLRTRTRELVMKYITSCITNICNRNNSDIHSEVRNYENFYLYIPDINIITSEILLVSETWDIWTKFRPKGIIQRDTDIASVLYKRANSMDELSDTIYPITKAVSKEKIKQHRRRSHKDRIRNDNNSRRSTAENSDNQPSLIKKSSSVEKIDKVSDDKEKLDVVERGNKVSEDKEKLVEVERGNKVNDDKEKSSSVERGNKVNDDKEKLVAAGRDNKVNDNKEKLVSIGHNKGGVIEINHSKVNTNSKFSTKNSNKVTNKKYSSSAEQLITTSEEKLEGNYNIRKTVSESEREQSRSDSSPEMLTYKFISSNFIGSDNSNDTNNNITNTNEVTLVIIDDWLINGHHTANLIDDIVKRNPNIKINFQFIIPYISQTAKRILSIFPNVKLLTYDEKWDVESINKPEVMHLIYSDIKMPESSPCSRKFYSECIRHPPFDINFVLETFFPNSQAAKVH